MIRTPQADARLSGAFRRAVGGALAVVMVAVGIATAVAAEPAEPSDVVVALDFSDSILSDKPNRTRFADALVEIADRVEVTRDDLVNGNAVISLVPVRQPGPGLSGLPGPRAPPEPRRRRQAGGLPPPRRPPVPARPERADRRRRRDGHQLRGRAA